MVQVYCGLCKKQFSTKPSFLKNGWGKYCSRICTSEAHRKGKIVECFTCNKEVYKQKKALTGSKSGKYFCGKSCQTKWRNTEFSQEKHPNWKDGSNAYRRILTQSKNLQCCKLCNSKDKRVLAVHHIDYNHKNNAIENLAWLCHNCHHLVHHHTDEHNKFMAAMV